jgi:CRP-like cAMP-binding protein
MLVLITGNLHVKDDQGQLVGQVLPGASFGEMACLTGHDRFAGFEAVEASTVLSLSRESLHAMIST